MFSKARQIGLCWSQAASRPQNGSSRWFDMFSMFWNVCHDLARIRSHVCCLVSTRCHQSFQWPHWHSMANCFWNCFNLRYLSIECTNSFSRLDFPSTWETEALLDERSSHILLSRRNGLFQSRNHASDSDIRNQLTPVLKALLLIHVSVIPYRHLANLHTTAKLSGNYRQKIVEW